MLEIEKHKLKLLLESKRKKIETPKYSGIGEIISAISLIITLCFTDFTQRPLFFQIAVWIIAILVFLIGIFLFFKNIIRFYSVDNLYNEIIELDPNIEHTFNIILIRNNYEEGKYLLFKSKRWKCWLFPSYSSLGFPYNEDEEISHIYEYLKRDIGVSGNINLKSLGDEISRKYSCYEKRNKKYHFHYFEASGIQINSNIKHSFYFNGKKYTWKTLDQMYTNKNIIKKNRDVLDYVRKKCEIS